MRVNAVIQRTGLISVVEVGNSDRNLTKQLDVAKKKKKVARTLLGKQI